MSIRRIVVDVETHAIDTAGDFVESASAPGNYKDPEKIAAYIAEANAKAVLNAGLDPDLARIVCIGWQTDDNPHVASVCCRTEEAEANALAYFWGETRGANLITFNGLKFDLPFLLRRSLYLGVKAPALNLDRYRSPHVDLMQVLSFNGTITAHSLKFYAKRLGLEHDDTSGKDIAALVNAAQKATDPATVNACWHAIEMHCTGDVRLTYQIAQRLEVIEGMPVEAREVA